MPRYFLSYNIREAVQLASCEQCKLSGRLVRMLTLIRVASFVLTIANSDSVLRPVGRRGNGANGARKLESIAPSDSPTTLRGVGTHRNL